MIHYRPKPQNGPPSIPIGVSMCCMASLNTPCSDEGTSYYQCSKCKQPTDPLYGSLKPMCPNCENGCSGNCLKEPVPKEDVINAPYHYTSSDIECIDAIKASLTKEEFRGFCKGTIQQYLWRERNKGGLESLQKAQWYLNRLVKEIENA